MKGRKRHAIVDTQGFLLDVCITAGNISDKQGLCQLLERKAETFKGVKKVWADHSYQAESLKKIALECGIELEIVKRPPGRYRIYNENWQAKWIPIEREFSILPRRWVVERTFAWLGRYRRMSKDYEYLTSTSRAVTFICSFRTMLKRLCKRE